MREIKFRAWDESNKEMRFSDKNDGEFYINLKGILYMYGIPKTDKYYKNYNVMQFTGLKDKNGVEIYEGDIVECKGNFCNIKYRVNFCDFVMDMNKYGGRLLNLTKANVTKYKTEIIGNIYENPELL